jgi:signal transduction histidine kinase
MTTVRRALMRIGGPAAISWPGFGVVLGLSFVIHLADAIGTLQAREIPLRVLAIALSVVAMFGAMLVLRRLLLHDVDTRPRPWRTIMVFVIGAIVRGLAIGWLTAMLTGIPATLGYRVPASIVTMVPVLIVVSILVDLARAQAARRTALLAASERLRAAEAEADAEVQAAHAATVDRIRSLLRAAIDETAGAAPAAVVARLRGEVNEVIRPLSHRLAGSVPTWAPPVDVAAIGDVAWRDLWRDVTRGRPFQPWAMAVIGAVMSLVGAVSRFGLLGGLLFAASLGVSIGVLFAMARRVVAPRLERLDHAGSRAALFLATVVVASVIAAVFVTVIVGPVRAVPASLRISIVVIGPLIAVLVATAQAVGWTLREADAELAAATISADRAVARVHEVAWQQRRVLALAVHGPLQARVSAAAIRLEQAVQAGSVSEADVAEARRSVLDALDQLDLVADDAGDVRADLADVAEAWEGVCAVVTELAAELAERIDRDPASARVVVDVFTEACSNAVRHARARDVALRIDEDGEGLLRVVICDDGQASEARADGLGNRLLDEIAVRWQRRRVGDTTELEVLLPALPGQGHRPPVRSSNR